MIKNYLRSAVRNIIRYPFISFINIFGLTIGLTCCLLILTYIINEKSYDKFNKNANDIYRVTRIFYTDGIENLHLSAIAPPFGPLLQNAFPDIKKVTCLMPNGITSLRYNDRLFDEKNAFYADENLFDLFSVPVIKGDPHKALLEPYSVMMTEDIAKKYFGNQDPVNKTIVLNSNKHAFIVRGIYKAFPANSHIHPEILMSFNTLKDSVIFGEKNLMQYYSNNFFTYLLFPKNYNVDRIEAQLPDFLDRYVHLPDLPSNFKTHQATQLMLQKLTDIHLRSHLADEAEKNGDIKSVYIFSAIALFILLIACINYMNLSTARSVLRAKEIGIRKVIGAKRKEIISQFLGESVLITLIALLFAMMLSELLLPFVNKLSDQELSFTNLLQWQILLPVMALPFVIGLISGIYPAIFISSFIPVKVFKGILKAGVGNISFRKVLVVVQFSISIILIVATTIVFQQLQYMQNKPLGFNKDHIITMNYAAAQNQQYDAFRADLIKSTAVKDLARSSRIPSGRLLDEDAFLVLEGQSMQPTKVDQKYIATDYDFLSTYGIKMAEGRSFSPGFPNDTNNYVINEAAVQAFGWKNPQNAIDKQISNSGIKGKVIGVVKDFHFESLHQNIIPLLFVMPSPANNYYNRLSIKIDGDNVKSAIDVIEVTWHKYFPETPFDYTFLDEKFAQLYNSEQQQGSLFTIFSCIAIFIACLGLFGLSAFIITQRVKEISVRKVLGASIPQIVAELSKDFLYLVLIAAIIAFPIAWYSMSKWLLDFAFRINIAWWVFALAGVVALIIAFATISFQSIKAAIANPVKSLRSE
jgi:putative ABC transport system permease protein